MHSGKFPEDGITFSVARDEINETVGFWRASNGDVVGKEIKLK